jgi:hypothetical protein
LKCFFPVARSIVYGGLQFAGVAVGGTATGALAVARTVSAVTGAAAVDVAIGVAAGVAIVGGGVGAAAVGRSVAATSGSEEDAGAVLSAGSEQGAGEAAAGSVTTATALGVETREVSGCRCRADTIHTAPITVTMSAPTPPSSTAVNWLRDALPDPVVAFRDASTGWPVVGRRGTTAATSLPASVRFGTVAGTSSRGAVVIGAP